MTAVHYRASAGGDWIAFVSASTVLAVRVGPSTEPPRGSRVEDLWSRVSAGTPVQDLLDLLTVGGISATPPFVLVEFGEAAEDPTTVVVRGEARVSVTGVDGRMTVDGAGVRTWAEESVSAQSTIDIELLEAAEADLFPLLGGVVRVAALVVGRPTGQLPSAEPTLPPRVEPVSGPVVEREPEPEPEPEPVLEPVPAAEPVPVLLDDPGRTISGPVEDISADQALAGPNYDFLFGETVSRSVNDAAIRPIEQLEADPADSGEQPFANGDRTSVLSAEERRAARKARARGSRLEAPKTVRLEFSTGDTHVLQRSMIVGRAPSASKVAADDVPDLVVVGGPEQDISRNHVEFRVEGGTVLVTDLHSRNGTVVTLPGRVPQQLRGGESTPVIAGTAVDLGSGIIIRVAEH